MAAETILRRSDGVSAASGSRPIARRLTARFGPRQSRSVSEYLPGGLKGALARALMASGWFTRRVVLDGWFLHAGVAPLAFASDLAEDSTRDRLGRIDALARERWLRRSRAQASRVRDASRRGNGPRRHRLPIALRRSSTACRREACAMPEVDFALRPRRERVRRRHGRALRVADSRARGDRRAIRQLARCLQRARVADLSAREGGTQRTPLCRARPPSGKLAARGAVRDALTLLDESGVIVARQRWVAPRRATRRSGGRSSSGRGAAELLAVCACTSSATPSTRSCSRPYVGLTGHAVLFEVRAGLIEAPLADRRFGCSIVRLATLIRESTGVWSRREICSRCRCSGCPVGIRTRARGASTTIVITSGQDGGRKLRRRIARRGS